MAIEEAKYEVVQKEDDFELRDYAAHILAETVVQGDMEDAGDEAFQLLFRYISGANLSREKVQMTAPVSQKRAGEKIEMTAPVGQQRAEEGWVISFMMPSSYSMETLPQPENPKVTLRQVPARRMAAVRYSGFWSEKGYLEHKQELEEWIGKMGFTVVGDPVWARYNSPFTLWFMRRNEVLIPVSADADREQAQPPSAAGSPADAAGE
jgi:effector-binding domain-containing protein